MTDSGTSARDTAVRQAQTKRRAGVSAERARVVAHPVLGFYGPGTQMWRINREAVLLGAGPAALLLQLAHPLVAEGVAQHSRFEDDPFARLRNTLKTTMDLVFGDGPTAEGALRRLNRVHATVRGEVADAEARQAGPRATSYRAMDPALLLWVQATLIVTSVQAYERWVGPLSADEKETFWQEARAVSPRMGIPNDRSPADWPALMDYWAAMLSPDGPIHVTPTARALSPTIVRPPLPRVPRPVLEALGLPGLALVPAHVRDGFGIAWSPRRERAAGVVGRAVRLWVRLVPASWRAMPHARTAERRARSLPDGSIQSERPVPQEPSRARD